MVNQGLQDTSALIGDKTIGARIEGAAPHVGSMVDNI
jgi:hypothetical protein